MRDVEHRVGGKREGHDRQRLPRVFHHGQAGGDQEPDRERDVEPHARLILVRDGQSDIGARGQRQQQRGHLGQPQFIDQPLRRRNGLRQRAHRQPREACREAAERDEDGTKGVAHAVSRNVSGSRW